MRGARMLARGQRMADERMTERVDVGLFTDGNDASGNATRVLKTERYTGQARIRWGSREVTNANAPSMHVALQEPYISVPVGSTRLYPLDEVHITESVDAILVDRRFRVQGAAAAGQVTAYRYPLEELS